ncbi:MFS transporter [Candidatus Nomurabacteria bacterium]|uniref:MFS transporter n=1 Tax=Candidatus Dojkabacteria bacterium TaxID=2099670 RepID=A0A955KWE6_9BACT|nr:MFS transporter [Candidatus Dojkabacteria bacterium]MCB9790020.1 MFS transporter [Candidatus Nomurabacteria bacterium]MCB9803393.1 MFS transporter [Candidatus Nomurabacteria bacterium]
MKKLFQNPFIPLLLTIFIDLLGVGIVIPILAPLFLSPGSSILPMEYTYEQRTLLIGLISATYPIMQFFGAPLLGSLSDRYGRKPTLILSLFGTFFGYILFGIGIIQHSLPLMFIGRAIDGFTGGNISIAQSAIADMTKPEERARNFGFIGMAFGLGFILGPYIGGKLVDPTIVSWFSNSTPYFFTAGLTLINILSLFLLFPETLKEKIKSPIGVMTGFRNLRKAISMTTLRKLFLVSFLLTFGFNFFTQFFNPFLIQKFEVTPSQAGDIFAYMGLFVALFQGGLLPFLNKRFNSSQILNVSIFGISLAFLLLLLPNKLLGIYLILPILALFQGLTQPNVTALISNNAKENSQGDILGVNQSINSLAQAIPPIISGFIFSINISLPILVGAGATLLAWMIFLVKKSVKEELFEEE